MKVHLHLHKITSNLTTFYIKLLLLLLLLLLTIIRTKLSQDLFKNIPLPLEIKITRAHLSVIPYIIPG